MIRLGLDRMEVQAVVRRSLSSRRLAGDDLPGSLATVIGEVIEENNKKLLEQLGALLEKENFSRVRR
ncbi:MAG: hypothetical protein PHV74_14530 [Dehalococcoidia bacterium]|nr:hypothetical protein [Dehalococcoidia bacterium]